MAARKWLHNWFTKMQFHMHAFFKSDMMHASDALDGTKFYFASTLLCMQMILMAQSLCC